MGAMTKATIIRLTKSISKALSRVVIGSAPVRGETPSGKTEEMLIAVQPRVSATKGQQPADCSRGSGDALWLVSNGKCC